MRSYPVKGNPIGSAVSDILRYKQTDKQTNRQTDIVLLCIIDIIILCLAMHSAASVSGLYNAILLLIYLFFMSLNDIDSLINSSNRLICFIVYVFEAPLNQTDKYLNFVGLLVFFLQKKINCLSE